MRGLRRLQAPDSTGSRFQAPAAKPAQTSRADNSSPQASHTGSLNWPVTVQQWQWGGDCVKRLGAAHGVGFGLVGLISEGVAPPGEAEGVAPPGWSKAVTSAALEAASSSTRGSGWAPRGRPLPGAARSRPEPPGAARLTLKRQRSRVGALPRGGHFDHAAPHAADQVRACVESKVVAQAAASWPSGGSSQRQSMPQAAPSSGQPRPISRLGGAGRPMRRAVRVDIGEPLAVVARPGVGHRGEAQAGRQQQLHGMRRERGLGAGCRVLSCTAHAGLTTNDGG
eukprot:scaffold95607_cov64-Phaeocystis_antarctica.AAC.2